MALIVAIVQFHLLSIPISFNAYHICTQLNGYQIFYLLFTVFFNANYNPSSKIE